MPLPPTFNRDPEGVRGGRTEAVEEQWKILEIRPTI
jgi:hypothetical protein